MFKSFTLATLAILLLAACGNEDEASGKKDDEGKVKVVTSFTIIEDLAREIGGDNVEIHNLVPTGTDPHEYEPTPDDTKAATDADILFYNGLNLEGGEKGWFFKMMDSVNQGDENVFSLTEEVDPLYIGGEDGHDEEINPHGFIDPAVGVQMAEAMEKAFVKKDPDNKDQYEKRAEKYLERLTALDEEYQEKINDIPKENRTLVTSERAFQYMAKHYGLEEAYIWEIDTEENGSAKQIKELVNFIKDNEVPVLFMESNVDRRPMESVSNDSGVDIAEKPIYSDEIGEKGEEVDTYMKYLQYNIDLMHDEMK